LDFVESNGQSEEHSIKRTTYYFVEDIGEQFNDDSIEKIFSITLSKTFEAIPKRILLRKKLYYIMCQGE